MCYRRRFNGHYLWNRVDGIGLMVLGNGYGRLEFGRGGVRFS